MEPLQKAFEHFFAALGQLQEKLSTRWREHSNRRSIVIVIIVGLLSAYLYINVIQPPDNFPVDQLVTVPSGATLSEIADTLKADGVIRSTLGFRIIATALGHQHDLRAGDYLFKEPIDIVSVARIISVGAYGLEPLRIRIPEGATTMEMAKIFSDRFERFNKANFLAEAQPLEGFLFPDTYFFLPNATESTIIQAMRQNFDLKEAQIDPLVKAFGKPLKDDVAMASILEREARNTQDRRMIAGVLWNRIARGMALQVDSSFLYTIGRTTFTLTKKDLATPSPYNTYLNKGLPPTAIGSPSLDSLLAAVTPVKNNYLFYLADNSGVTHYSKTYAQQLANERIYLGK